MTLLGQFLIFGGAMAALGLFGIFARRGSEKHDSPKEDHTRQLASEQLELNMSPSPAEQERERHYASAAHS